MSGSDPAIDEITAAVPSEPTYREGASIWMWDDVGRFCFPRLGIEAVGATWVSVRETAVCVARPDGRLLLVTTDDVPRPVADGQGRPRVFGAGPLTFECVEPFRHWRMTYEGDVVATTAAEFLARGAPKLGLEPGRERVALRLAVDARSTCPPWFQGTHEPEGHFVPGERRFEQLCAVAGSVEIGGERSRFKGGGLRVHRKGGNRSDYGTFHGHVWASAQFPSGRAFGLLHYRPAPDGTIRYREGWYADARGVVPARVEHTPWLRDVQLTGEDVSFTLTTPRGEVRVRGETYASSFRPPRPTVEGTTVPLLHSAIARYHLGDESAFGMLERSARL